VHLRVKTYQLLSINLDSIWHNTEPMDIPEMAAEQEIAAEPERAAEQEEQPDEGEEYEEVIMIRASNLLNF
jgi:hypothetical protein